MKKQNLKNLNLRKKVISSLKIEAVKGQFRRGSEHEGCSGDTALIYTCHEKCNAQEDN